MTAVLWSMAAVIALAGLYFMFLKKKPAETPK